VKIDLVVSEISLLQAIAKKEKRKEKRRKYEQRHNISLPAED